MEGLIRPLGSGLLNARASSTCTAVGADLIAGFATDATFMVAAWGIRNIGAFELLCSSSCITALFSVAIGLVVDEASSAFNFSGSAFIPFHFLFSSVARSKGRTLDLDFPLGLQSSRVAYLIDWSVPVTVVIPTGFMITTSENPSNNLALIS